MTGTALALLLYCVKDSVNDSTGFTAPELMFDHEAAEGVFLKTKYELLIKATRVIYNALLHFYSWTALDAETHCCLVPYPFGKAMAEMMTMMRGTPYPTAHM